MSTVVVPVRLKSRDLEQIDQLIELGIFKSRSEALRELIKLGIENLRHIAETSRALEKLFKLEKSEGRIPISLNGATKQLLKERERIG